MARLFLQGVRDTANQATRMANSIDKLFRKDKENIELFGRGVLSLQSAGTDWLDLPSLLKGHQPGFSRSCHATQQFGLAAADVVYPGIGLDFPGPQSGYILLLL